MGLPESELDRELAALGSGPGSRSASGRRSSASGTRSRSRPGVPPFRRALIDLCFERGLHNLTVADLCARSGLRRAAFEDRYADLADCAAEVTDVELRRYHRRALAARAGLDGWRERLRATTYALYRYLAEDEPLRRFILIEARTAGERPGLLIGAELEALYDLIDEGRDEATAPPSLTRATAESLGGAIFNQIYVAAGHGGPLPPEAETVPTMMYAAVLPYLGVHAAAEELRISPPPG